MTKKAILIVSFGTTVQPAAEQSIGALRKQAAAKYPEYTVTEAYTSGMVIAALAKQGVAVPTVARALADLAQQGYEQVYLQPTHLLAGEEFEKLCRQAAGFADSFKRLCVGEPLFSRTEDYFAVANAIAAQYPLQREQALVLMGHGSSHPANCAYPAFAYVLRDLGLEHIFVGTVEGYPAREDILRHLQSRGYQSLLLAPLMLVAGDHARNDMAGEEDSWKNFFEAQGYTVRTMLKGIGEIERIRSIYLAHINALVNADA